MIGLTTPFLNADVGMIAARIDGNASFSNCTSGGTLNFNAPTFVRKNSKGANENTPVWIGGMAGRVSGTSTFTSCKNTAMVNTTNTTAVVYVGGFLGNANDSTTFTGCTNTAVVNTTNTASVVSAGGFLGNANKGITMTDCTNNGAMVSQNSTAYTGGFIGQLKNNATNTFTNCTNGAGGNVSRSMTPNNLAIGAAGFIGILHGESQTSLKVQFVNCVNDADILNTALPAGVSSQDVNEGTMLGGFIGEARCATNVEFKNCINNGDVKVSDKDTVGNYQGSGGFIGCQRIAGFSWTSSVKTITTKFINCLNTGEITSVHSAGGLVGHNIEMQKPDDTYGEYAMTIENCVNTGNITAPQAGGMYGAANDASGYSCVAKVTFNKCLNAGTISYDKDTTKAYLGGIIGDANDGVVTVSNSVNAGTVKKGNFVAGIIGNITLSDVNISNSYSLGEIDTESTNSNPISNGESDYKGNLFDEELFDDWFDEAKDVSLEKVEEAVDKLGIMAGYGFDRLDDMIKEIDSIEYKKAQYDATLWKAVETAYAEAKRVKGLDVLTLKSGGNAEILDQKEVNKAYYDLYDARYALGDKVLYTDLKAAISDAEELKASDYTEASWSILQIALSSAKSALTYNDQAMIDDACKTLTDAITALVKADGTPSTPSTPNTPENPENNESPENPENTEASTTTKDPDANEPTEEKGCGSVLGGAAVVLLAVMAVGTGISFKKKED